MSRRQEIESSKSENSYVQRRKDLKIDPKVESKENELIAKEKAISRHSR